MKKILFLIIVVIVILFSAFTLFKEKYYGPVQLRPTTSTQIQNGTQKPERIETVAENLEVPWALAFLPNGDLLITERPGRVRIITSGGLQKAPILDINVSQKSESGLHGIAVHPEFESNKYVYIYYTYISDGDQTMNRVSKFTLNNNLMTGEKVIIDQIPGALFHDGGRIKFGPDGFLYVSTGDATNPSLSQNKDSKAGKILRITDDGKAAPGNPFGTIVYTYGHRNPQGLAWDSEDRLFETEHGNNATDEVNVLISGKNYGWPEITGEQTKDGMESPLAQSGGETWAPGGAAFHNNSLFFTGLRGTALFELETQNGNAIITKHLLGEFGRIRDVVLGPDNLLYIATSNRDGRGSPADSDDRILKIDPTQL